MKPKQIVVPLLCVALSGCATMEKSVLLGAGTMGAIGTGVGAAAGNNVGGALLGLGIGAVFGGLMGFAGHKDQEEKARQAKSGTKKTDDTKVPSLTSPEVRRVWVPEKIDGGKFIEGHYMYVIERNSVWSK
jgi:hypothetical protein